jgi:hypothetical protein
MTMSEEQCVDIEIDITDEAIAIIEDFMVKTGLSFNDALGDILEMYLDEIETGEPPL